MLKYFSMILNYQSDVRITKIFLKLCFLVIVVVLRMFCKKSFVCAEVLGLFFH